jgi:hypothetical protein
MALNDLELSLMAFPQRWDGAGGILAVNLLLLPVGDPTAPLGTGPQFAGTSVHLNVNVVAGLATLPSTATTPSQLTQFAAQPPPAAAALYTQLYSQLTKKVTVNAKGLTTPAQAPHKGARIFKSLPASYTEAFAFSAPRTNDLFVGDGYGCALRDQAPKLNEKPVGPDTSIAWGQVLSYALHQPVLATAMGLIYSVPINIPSGLLASGGFVYFTLDASVPGNPWVADWKSNPDTVKSYAARLPALASAATASRQLFAARLLPIVATPPSNLTEAQFEAEEYDDGFAQIVHSNQPTTIDAATLDPSQIAPATDAGIQIGWDDEQVTVWFNNQVDLLRYRLDPTSVTPPPAEAPLGVIGYRVDVRIKGTTTWQSLCEIDGTLPFNQGASNGSGTTPISGNEFWLAPAPIRRSTTDNTTNNQPAWLPLYFAQWTGSSLVLPDPVVRYLATAFSQTNTGNPLPAPPALSNPSPDLTAVPNLVYSNPYEFRVRLVDLTGGGPLAIDAPIHPGPAPQALTDFLRYLPPKALEIVAAPAIAGYPSRPPTTRTIQTLDVKRPRIGYPEAIYAGVDPATFALSNLQTLIEDAWSSGRSVSVPDPDVVSFDVRAEARIPANDTGTAGTDPGDLDGNFRVIYTVNVPFPTDQGTDPTVMITLNYTDGVDDISTLTAPAPGTTTLPIPTARDIRVRLYPRCDPTKANYYGSDRAQIGPSTDYIVRREASTEDALFPNTPESQLQAFYFQPGSNLPQLLAQQLGLNQQALTFTGASGLRTVFGASGTLRHNISGDGSSLTIANQTELLGHWIVALVLDIERDWTWDGLIKPGPRQKKSPAPQFEFTRDGRKLGVITVPRVLSPAVTANSSQPPDRSRTRIIFFDTLDGNPAVNAFPDTPSPTYTVSAHFAKAAQQQFNFPITLPITTPPAQTPKIVSTGIAEGPYVHSATYSQTNLRERYLWIEFDKPVSDPDDTFFGRVLAYGPDPLLAADLLPKPAAEIAEMLPETAEPVLPIDPEPVRRIFSGQSADYSGLDAMTQMVPAISVGVGKSGTFFLLPLPSGMTSDNLELFGFWTYEFRTGHLQKWSTAQGRYGRPLRVTGIQHPAPHLICTASRNVEGIYATAPYANTVYNGRRVYDYQAGDPQTRIWFMLYAQVLQADGASWRNVLLTHKQGITLPNPPKLGSNPQQSFNRDPRAGIGFQHAAVEKLLTVLGLPTATPLSLLAVEILPGPLDVGTDVPGRRSEAGLFATTADGSPDQLAATVGRGEDPLGAELGLRRILRTSPLVAVPAIC